ncbi:MAG: MFS transporter [Geminicoccaceae bacterium]
MTSAARQKPTLLTLIVLSAVAVLPVSMFPPSLPGIARAFEVDYAIVNLAVAGYAWTAAAMQLVMGPLSDRFGRRPVLLASLAAFALASLGCAMAPGVGSFLAFRLLQAVVIAGYSVSLAVIRDCWDEREAASVIGYVSVGWALAPMLGPVLGGLLDGLFGWRAIFWAHILAMTFTTGAFYAFLSAAPLAAKSLFAMSPAILGIYMGSSTAGFMLGSFLAGRYADRYAPTTTMTAGMMVACAGLAVGLVLLSLGIVHPAAIFGPCVCFGLGNGLTMAGASAGALSVQPGLAGGASGLAGSLSVAGAAAVSSITGAILTDANSGYVLLGMMLATCLASLFAAVAARRLQQNRRESQQPA